MLLLFVVPFGATQIGPHLSSRAAVCVLVLSGRAGCQVFTVAGHWAALSSLSMGRVELSEGSEERLAQTQLNPWIRWKGFQ